MYKASVKDLHGKALHQLRVHLLFRKHKSCEYRMKHALQQHLLQQRCLGINKVTKEKIDSNT